MHLVGRWCVVLWLSLGSALADAGSAHTAAELQRARAALHHVNQSAGQHASQPVKRSPRARVAKVKKTAIQAKKPVLLANAPHQSKLSKRSKTQSAKASRRSASRLRAAALTSASMGHQLGLNRVDDQLNLRSSVALVMDPNTREVLISKNDGVVLPIASLTKLMTALVINDQDLDMDEVITITQDDVDTLKGSSSRLRVGSRLTRGELLHLALMSSENRAAHALGRTFPGGLSAFVRNMNTKAKLLGMSSTRYVEPTGLSSDNRSNARDLARLVSVAATRPLLRKLSTDEAATVSAGRGSLDYRNTNALVRSDAWDIKLQKTGYISEAGRCLVLKAQIGERPVIMVFLDSVGKYSRLGDANRVRKWLESQDKISHAADKAAQTS
jgi:serine-type D-Ala-D-Ala endopeptidase (penicillin-binding protein 7)